MGIKWRIPICGGMSFSDGKNPFGKPVDYNSRGNSDLGVVEPLHLADFHNVGEFQLFTAEARSRFSSTLSGNSMLRSPSIRHRGGIGLSRLPRRA